MTRLSSLGVTEVNPDTPDLCAPLTVCVDEVPPLVVSGVLLDDVRQLPATDTPLKTAVTAEPPE